MKKIRSHKWKAAAAMAFVAMALSSAAAAASSGGYAGPVITPNPLSFGDVAVGTTSATQTVSVSAGSGGDGNSLSIVSITFPAGFARNGGSCPASGTAPNPCTMGVVYSPTQIGPQAGNVVITASSIGQPPGSSNLAVSGNGVGGSLISVPALGGWGFGLLLAALLGSGFYFARRR